MSEMLAGTVSGILMGVIFVGVGAATFFSFLKNSPNIIQTFAKGSSPAFVAVPIAFVLQVIWAIWGLVMGILYGISVERVPGGGMGSPNLVYTLGVIVVAGAMALPFFILLHRAWRGLALLVVAFVGIFGWFLPYFTG